MMMEEDADGASQPAQACPVSPTLTDQLEEILDDEQASHEGHEFHQRTDIPLQGVPPLPAGGNALHGHPSEPKEVPVGQHERCQTPPRKSTLPQSFQSWPTPPPTKQASSSSASSKMEITPEKKALFKRIKQLEGQVTHLQDRYKNYKTEAAQEMEARLENQQHLLDQDFQKKASEFHNTMVDETQKAMAQTKAQAEFTL